ncbi:tyrosine-type recombinase/integrase [Cytobacillus firmus]|uniref:tyrosine-type recombinase/integrase n=1 Tax=Cytobacillus firmus TaxID=1399 RepID=UPI0024C0FC77|nr:tyrosine-type recombinase/integrase [Cytobacillus firmus]WHY63650.1 type I restriction enzyme HsdR N-terminal domain-containing protein [Cytobacillus firmus]
MDGINIDKINELRKKYSELPDYNEETIKIRIVKPFIEILGFNEDWHRYEYPVIKNKKITDITLIKNNKIILVVEVKKGGNYWIKPEDIQQLLTYLMTKNVEWGIVTNGKEFILVNYKINGELQHKEVLKYNLLDKTDESSSKILSYDSIFQNQKTNFYKHLAQFKCYKLQERDNYLSWSIYNSTISNYFQFISSKYNSYRRLEYLSKQDFKEFINFDISQSKIRNRHINSKQTVMNKFRHIAKMYELFVQHEELNHNPFRFISQEEMISNITGLDFADDDNIENLDVKDFKQLIDFFDNTQNPERNKLILLLCLYGGLGRDSIRHLKINDFNFNTNTLKVKEIELPLPSEFIQRIRYYIENIRNKNAKVEYLFDSNYGNYAGEPLSQSIINTVIKRSNVYVNNTLPSNKNFKVNPEKIRKLLVRRFFESGFSIEEIVTITSMELHRVAEHITTEEIKERTIISSLPDKHPYLDLFKDI